MAFQFTDANVKEVIASGKPVVIDCWATWCGPCVRMSPIIDELAEEFGDKAVIPCGRRLNRCVQNAFFLCL